MGPVTIATTTAPGGSVAMTLTAKSTDSISQAGTAELQQLLSRAQQGDLTVLGQLRRVLEDTPQLWETFGNLAAQAEGALVKLAAGTDLLLALKQAMPSAIF